MTLSPEVREIVALSCPKSGFEKSQNDDAVGWGWSPDCQGVRVAIADGVTASIYADRWAQILVRRCLDVVPYGLPLAQSWTRPARREFYQSMNYEGISWFAAEKLKSGAQATFLALNIDIRLRRYTMVGVGDCCLVVLNHRNGESEVYPQSLAERGAFGSQPPVFSTLPGEVNGATTRATGLYDGETTFLLMTDGMAEWFLSYQRVAPNKAWKVVQDLESEDDLKRLVRYMRSVRLMKDDDISFVRLRLR